MKYLFMFLEHTFRFLLHLFYWTLLHFNINLVHICLIVWELNAKSYRNYYFEDDDWLRIMTYWPLTDKPYSSSNIFPDKDDNTELIVKMYFFPNPLATLFNTKYGRIDKWRGKYRYYIGMPQKDWIIDRITFPVEQYVHDNLNLK